MKKKRKSEMDDELRPEYDLRELLKGGGQREVRRTVSGWDEPSPIFIAPDVAKAFANDAEAVNEALRLVIQLKKVSVGKKQQLAKQ